MKVRAGGVGGEAVDGDGVIYITGRLAFCDIFVFPVGIAAVIGPFRAVNKDSVVSGNAFDEDAGRVQFPGFGIRGGADHNHGVIVVDISFGLAGFEQIPIAFSEADA